MKKIISSFLAVLIVIMMVPMSVMAMGEITMSAAPTNMNALHVGDKVTIKVLLPEVTTPKLQFDLVFDTDKFQYNDDVDISNVSAKLSIAKAQITTEDSSKLRLVATGMDPVKFESGTTAMTASFTVKESYGTVATAFRLDNLKGTTDVSLSTVPLSATILKAPIASVSASVEKPEAGKKLDFTGSVDSSAPYKITKVEWFESTNDSGTPVTDTTATAKAEQYYYARITLTAKSGETFAEKFKTGANNGDYSVTRNSDTELYLTKAYPKTGSLPAASVTAPTAKTDLKYTGSDQALLSYRGTATNGTMQYSLNGTDWTDTDPMGKDAGDYTVYYKAKGDSSHSDSAVAHISVTIAPKDISGVTIGTITDQSYTGSAITPDPKVTDGTTELKKDKDYTVSCTDKYVGTATLTITGKGNYTGTKTANFTIVAAEQTPTFTTPVNLATGGAMLDLRDLVRNAQGAVTFTISGGGGTSTYARLEDGHILTSTGIPGTVNINVRIAAQNEGGDSAPEYNEFIQTDAITVKVVNKTPDSTTMKVSQSNITYGETVSPSVTNKPDDTGTVSYTYVGRNGTSYSSSATAPKNVGEYTVKAKCESSTTIYTAEANFAIQPKSISGMTVTLSDTSLEYNGSAQTVTVTSVGSLTTADYNVTGKTSGTNVGSYTVTVTGKGNYTDTATATWKITQATPTYTAPTGLTAKYGQTLADVNIGATTGWSWMDSTESVGDASTTPKTFKAKFAPTDTTNYKTVENIDVSVTVGKADAPTLENITVNQKYNVTTEQNNDIGAAGMPDDAGTLTYAKGTESKTGSVAIDSWAVDATTGKVTYKLSGGKADDTVTLPVIIKSTNYADATVNVVITLIKGSSGGYYYAPTVPDMPMLYRGCTGDAVKTLQDKLNALGYNSGSVDGIFGAKTYAAVTAFQKANSLGVDGIVGKLTWGKLYGVSPAMPVETTTVVGRPMVSYGSRGDAVRKLQELLNALGYDCGSVDGIFGSKTKAAVLAFQKANGLGVDGIVGPLTWAKLG